MFTVEPIVLTLTAVMNFSTTSLRTTAQDVHDEFLLAFRHLFRILVKYFISLPLKQ